jgi:uncharacterized membrane protein YdjX (TVP38/TMEM64 family)
MLTVLIAAVGYFLGWHRYLSLAHIVEHYDRLQSLIDANFPLALASYMVVYIAIVALSLPGGAVATMAGGLLFGWLVGGSAAVVAATVGASIVFWVVKTSLGRLLSERAGPWLVRLRAGFEADALSYMLFLRLVPAFPFVAVNVAPALLGVRFRTYLIGTLFGILPATYAFSYVGTGLAIAVERQHEAHLACLARQANEPSLDCAVGIDTSALPLTELSIAFLALALLALLPIVVKRWWPKRAG